MEYGIPHDKIIFGEIEVKSSAFHKFKYPIDINDVNIGKIKTSKKCSYGKKRFEYITTMSPSAAGH